MPEFLKVNATESDPITRWINLDAVMFVTSTKNHDGNRLNIKFIDSTNMVIDGELTKELNLALDLLSVNNRLLDEQNLRLHREKLLDSMENNYFSDDDTYDNYPDNY
jgi:hypothetical protein